MNGLIKSTNWYVVLMKRKTNKELSFQSSFTTYVRKERERDGIITNFYNSIVPPE